MSHPLFFHLHIPKTAGSLFNQLLRKNFGTRFLHENPYLSTHHYAKEDVLKMIEFYNFNTYSGHVFNLNNTPFAECPGLSAISFVRDPIEKYFSFYFFQRTRQVTDAQCAAKRLDLSNYIQWHLNNQSVEKEIDRDSGQLQWISGNVYSIDGIKKLINSKRYLVFPSERFNEAVFLLKAMFPDHLPDCSYKTKVNESKRDQPVSDDLKDQVRNFSWVAEDREFHRLANECLDNLIVEVFGDTGTFQQEMGIFNAKHQPESKKEIKLDLKARYRILRWLKGLRNIY